MPFHLTPTSLLPELLLSERRAILALAKPIDTRRAEQEVQHRYPLIIEFFSMFGADSAGCINNPYSNVRIPECFDNVYRHSLAAYDAARKILKRLQLRGYVDSRDVQRACHGALCHDLDKPLEVMRRWAREGDLSEVYSRSSYRKAREALTEYGVSPQLIREFEFSSVCTGHNAISSFLEFERIWSIRSSDLVRLSLYVIDALTYSSKANDEEAEVHAYLPVLERMMASRFPERYPFLWNDGLGIMDGTIVALGAGEDSGASIHAPREGVDVLGHYAYLHYRVATEGARILCERLGLEDSSAPDRTLCDFLYGAASVTRSVERTELLQKGVDGTPAIEW